MEADNELLIKESLPLISFYQLIRINSFWFAYQLFWFVLTIVVVPTQIEQLVGTDKKGSGLAVINFTSGFIVMISSIVIGVKNDRFHSNYGKRYPWIVVGSVGSILSVLAMCLCKSLATYTIAYCILNFMSALASVPFNGLIADLCRNRTEQVSLISAVTSSMNLLGYLIGALLGALLEPSIGNNGLVRLSCLFLSIGTVITNLTPFSHEPLVPDHSFEWKRFFFEDVYQPLKMYPNFRLLTISRFLFQIGINTVQQFLHYWIEDCTNPGINSGQAVSLALLPSLVISPIGAYLIPKNQRKRIVYFSTTIMVVACCIMMFSNAFWSAFIISGIFGVGYGPFQSTEFAMLMDVLPNADSFARDISIWHTAFIVPQLTATPLAGTIRDQFEYIGDQNGVQCLGYKVVNLMTIVYLICGALITRKIQGLK